MSVLVVDGSRLLRECRSETLSDAGVAVVEAGDIRGAHAQLARELEDVVVVDSSFRDGAGLESVLRVRHSGAAAAVGVWLAAAEGLPGWWWWRVPRDAV